MFLKSKREQNDEEEIKFPLEVVDSQTFGVKGKRDIYCATSPNVEHVCLINFI